VSALSSPSSPPRARRPAPAGAVGCPARQCGYPGPPAAHSSRQGKSLKIRSSPPARRPSKEESQRPADQQPDRKDHGEEGDYCAAQSLENSRRHEVVGGDEQQLMGQHADSMAGCTLTSGGRTAVSAMPLAPAQHQRQKSAFVGRTISGITGSSMWVDTRTVTLLR
jgi:hypothetical protein